MHFRVYRGKASKKPVKASNGGSAILYLRGNDKGLYPRQKQKINCDGSDSTIATRNRELLFLLHIQIYYQFFRLFTAFTGDDTSSVLQANVLLEYM